MAEELGAALAAVLGSRLAVVDFLRSPWVLL